ncbi:MAG: YhcH/YjgK/YiaL family protein [Ignavibacteriales bacterium]
MVFDSLDNFHQYVSLHPYFRDVNEFLVHRAIRDLEVGNHDVNDRGAFAIVSEYLSKDISEGFIEFHKKYIDIQIVLKGAESVGLCSRPDCRELEFNAEKDYGKLSGDVSFLALKENYFLILFPQDGHMPQLMYSGLPEPVKKMVIKIPVL